MKKTILSVIFILFGTITTFAQITGTVRSDTKKPLKGVVVSDGYGCTSTNDKGEFSLPNNPNSRFVFITKPTGWSVRGRHYIDLRKQDAVTPKGNHFVLEKSDNDKDGNFSFVQITDVESVTKKGWIDNLRQWVATNPTAFIVNTGDICYEGGLRFNGEQLRSEHFSTDFFYCIGNHDLVKGKYGEELFEHFFGPTYYSFDAGNVHFMVLPMLGGDYKPSYTKAQLMEWMRKDLALKDPAKKVVMFNHDLWFTGDDLKLTAGGDTLDMADHNLIAFCYGHWHNHYAKQVAGIKTFSTSPPDKGGIDHGASVFRVLDVTADGQITSRSRYTGIGGTLSSVVPSAGDCLKAGKNRISVNAYRTSSPTTGVSVMLGGKWIALKPTSDWNWSGDVTLAAGKHSMKSKAVFADGTELIDDVSFTVDKNPTVMWNRAVGSNIWMVKPVIVGGKLFTATIDDDNNDGCYVICFDAVTGAELWRTKTDNSLKNTIAATTERVVALDADGQLYCIDAQNGRVIWKTKLAKELLPSSLQGIAIDGDRVYAGQGNGFSAIDLQTGNVVWNNTEWSGGQGTTSTIVVSGDVVVASAHWNGIFAHDKNTGKLLWKSQNANTRFRDGSPTFSDDTMFLATTNMIFKIDPMTGSVLQSAVCDVDFSVAAAPVVTSDVIYCSTSDRGIAAFDRHSLKKLWGYNSAPAMFYTVPYAQDFQCSVESSPILHLGAVIFAATDGNLYGVNAKDGATLFKRRVGSPIFSTPTIDRDGLFISDFAGNVIKLSLDKLY